MGHWGHCPPLLARPCAAVHGNNNDKLLWLQGSHQREKKQAVQVCMSFMIISPGGYYRAYMHVPHTMEFNNPANSHPITSEVGFEERPSGKTKKAFPRSTRDRRVVSEDATPGSAI
jgi:hypothetical protein